MANQLVLLALLLAALSPGARADSAGGGLDTLLWLTDTLISGLGVLAPLTLVVILVALLVLPSLLPRLERRALERAAAANGLELQGRGLMGRGLELRIVTRSSRRGSVETLRWRQKLPDFPTDLKLSREGAESGAAYAQGAREVVSGDLDFDDMFWIQSQHPQAALEYLNPARRQLLLEVMQNLPGSLEEGALVGQVPYNARILARAAREAPHLAEQLANPPLLTQARQPGWVNRRQRLHHAARGGLGAGLLGVGPALWLACLPGTQPSSYCLIPLTLAGLLAVSALGLATGLRGASLVMRSCLQVCRLGLLGLFLSYAGVTWRMFDGLTFVLLMVAQGLILGIALIWLGSHLENWRLALLRVRSGSAGQPVRPCSPRLAP